MGSSRRASSHALRCPSDDDATLCRPLVTASGTSSSSGSNARKSSLVPGSKSAVRAVSSEYPPPIGHRSRSGSSSGTTTAPLSSWYRRHVSVTTSSRSRSGQSVGLTNTRTVGGAPPPKRSPRSREIASWKEGVEATRPMMSAASTTPRTHRGRDEVPDLEILATCWRGINGACSPAWAIIRGGRLRRRPLSDSQMWTI